MRLEQKNKSDKGHDKMEAPKDFKEKLNYPSTRYFQIHFQYLHELIESLKEHISESNRKIAAQNEIIQNILLQPDRYACTNSQETEELISCSNITSLEEDDKNH